MAVPAEFVPSRFWLLFAALPTPLGSLPVLKPPAGLAGPVTPLTAVVPAPGEPALGSAVTPPVVAPALDAPPDEAPPLEPPPAPPPPPPPPCAKPGIGASNNVVASKDLTVHLADMAISLLTPTPLQSPRSSEPEGFALGISDGSTQAVPRRTIGRPRCYVLDRRQLKTSGRLSPFPPKIIVLRPLGSSRCRALRWHMRN